MKTILLFSIVLFAGAGSFCQTRAGIDSANIARTVGLYFNAARQNAPIYNGAAYAGYEKGIIGSPFFGSERLSRGTVFYSGIRYDNIQMAYDLVSDYVVIEDFRNQNLLIVLVNEKIDSFIVNGHLFINSNQAAKEESKPGFLDLVYNGTHKVVVKHRKQIEARPLEEKEKSIFTGYDYYYAKQQSGYVPVTNMAGLLRLFGDKKSQVRKYLREHNIKFKNDPEKTIVEAARYYDGLAN